MKKRYLIATALFALCVCLALGVLALLPPRPGVTKANFDRIEIGMTVAEVDQIFGPPSGYFDRTELIPKRIITWEGWQDDGMSEITFDTNGCVKEMAWQYHETSFLKRIFRHLMP